MEKSINAGDDAILDVAVPAEGRSPVFIQIAASFVTAFLPDSPAGDVGEHIIGVAHDPRTGAVFLFESECVINDGFGSHADPLQFAAEQPDVEWVR